MLISRINQVLNANNELSEANTNIDIETNSDTSLRTGYRPSSKTGSEPDFDLNNIVEADLVFGVLATETDKSRINKKKECKSNKSDVAKRVNLSDKMFEYIYIA